MKTLLKVLVLGIFLAAVVPVFAQDEGPTLKELYDKWKVEKAKDCGSRDTAVAIGKQIIEKFGNDEENKAVIDYVKKNNPLIEQEDAGCKRVNRFVNAYKASNWDEVFAAGKDIIANNHPPDVTLDVTIAMAAIGFDQATANPPVNKYNSDILNFAKTAIQKMGSGVTSKNFGYLKHSFATKEADGGKENAIGWLNYYIGTILNVNQKDTAGSLPYLYKSTQFKGTQNIPWIYQAIGVDYLQKAIKAREDALKKFEENKAQTNEDLKKQNEDEINRLAGLAKAYSERAMDAYGRAYKIALEDKNSSADYKKSLYNKLTELYKFRFDKTDGQDAFVSSLISRPMPDPASEVKPIIEAPPTTTTTSTTPTSTTNTNTTTTTNTTKTPTTPTKPTSTTTTNSVTNSTTTATTKPPTTVKKTLPKKKGTR